MTEAARGSDAASSTTGASVLKGTLWTAFTRLTPQVYMLVISVAAARILGPEGLGRQSFVAFAEIALIRALTEGTVISLVRFIGESVGQGRPDAVQALVRWGWRVGLLAAVFGGGVLLLVARLGAEPTSAWVLASVACSAGILHSVPSAILIGLQRWRAATIAGLVNGALATVATIWLLAAGGGIAGMFAIEACMSTLNLIWTNVLARRAVARMLERLGPAAVGDPLNWRELRGRVLRYSLWTSYGAILTVLVWRRSEIFFLERFSTDTEIALYSITFAMVTAILQVPCAAGSVIFPAVATLSGAGAKGRIQAGFGRALRMLLILSLPLAAAAVVAGPTLLQVIYGGRYRPAGPVLLMLLVSFPLIPLLDSSRALLMGIGRLRLPLVIESGAAVLDIAICLLLIPSHGAWGAAVANVAAQIAAAVPITYLALVRIGATDWTPLAAGRAAFASIGAGGVAALVLGQFGGAAGLLAGGLAGALVFTLLALGLRILPAEDAAWLDLVAGSQLGGLVGRACRLLAQPAGSR